MSVVGNVSVIYAVSKVKKLKTIPNYFVLNLAVADFLFALTGMPMILVTTIAEDWILGSFLCDLGGFLNTLFCTVSIWTLAMISVHRYFAVARARTVSNIYTKKRTGIIIGVVWFLAAAISCPPLLGWSSFKAGTNFCTIDGKDKIEYSIFVVFCVYFIPLFTLSGLYVKIFFLLQKHEKQMQKSRSSSNPISGDSMCDKESSAASGHSDTDSQSSEEKHSVKKADKKSVTFLSKFLNSPKNKYATEVIKQTSPDGNSVNSVVSNKQYNELTNKDSFISLVENTPLKDANTSSLTNSPSIITLTKTNSHAALIKSSSGKIRDKNLNLEVRFEDSVDSVSSFKDNPATKTVLSDTATPIKIRRKRSSGVRRFFREAKVTKMLFTVVVVFFLCWTPFVVASVLYGLNLAPSNFQLLSLGIMLACLNSICNPVIYALMNRNFRGAFAEIFRKLKRTFCCAAASNH